MFSCDSSINTNLSNLLTLTPTQFNPYIAEPIQQKLWTYRRIPTNEMTASETSKHWIFSSALFICFRVCTQYSSHLSLNCVLIFRIISEIVRQLAFRLFSAKTIPKCKTRLIKFNPFSDSLSLIRWYSSQWVIACDRLSRRSYHPSAHNLIIS